MIHVTYEFVCPLPARAASERIESLLAREGVEYRTGTLSIVSIRTPLDVLGIQPRLYSRSNWVGLNPFAFVSGVDAKFEELDGPSTRVTVRVNRRRALLWVAFWVACSLLAARKMPEPGGVIFLVGAACAAWVANVSFLAGHLMRKEIGDRLKTE